MFNTYCGHAVAVLPLIRLLRAPSKWTQNWYADDSSCVADDSSCVADLLSLQTWFEELSHKGPDYGYYPEPSKTVLVVGPSDVKWASELFKDLGIVSGGRLLGGFLVMILWLLSLFPVRYTCGPACVHQLAYVLFLSLRLLMLHWQIFTVLVFPSPESDS